MTLRERIKAAAEEHYDGPAMVNNRAVFEVGAAFGARTALEAAKAKAYDSVGVCRVVRVTDIDALLKEVSDD